MSDILNGMKEITQYIGRCETTVLDMHRKQDLPMRKNKGTGVWVSSKKKVDEWNQKLLNGESTLRDDIESFEIALKGNQEAIDGFLAAGYVKTSGRKIDGAQFITLTLRE